MGMEKMLEEYRQAQRIRISRKLTKKAMTLVQFKKVEVQDGNGPRFKDVTMEIRKGILPDPGVVLFYNIAAKFHLTIVGSSFIFNDKLPCEKQLKIIFDEEGEEEKREDIHLTFTTKDLKDECAAALINYLDLRSITFLHRYCTFQRNEPCSLPAIVEMIAAFMNKKPEDVALATSFNALKLFGLSQ